MNIIYIHGLDSDANSTKGILLESCCQQHHADINVYHPDLNSAPAQVFEQLVKLVTELNRKDKTVLIGSSLGGYFSTLVSNHTGCPALLLNPSTQPHVTLQRFSDISVSNKESSDELSHSNVLHTTAGGWEITPADLQWFADHQLVSINYPHKIAVLLKEDDELLNAELSKDFYQTQGATVTVQAGGDHRFTDFGEQLPMVIGTLQCLLST
ncbi:YqiA/YcfP family alpha/beta fold hydrolase [Psychrobacter sp. PAMC 21119]|uniref:YqiA/YcfP family alpha/beta fold hydrolase n=1 Tax=Psychrobacter sp. PAMC 21119 TaxID=1112209 RepID=UPI000288AE28|nr:YqiA/YcfP family alpha/beta fold hydrolase [Psychrobacter sp. PAMC 21119]